MTGAKIWVPDIVIELTEDERQRLALELWLTVRDDAPYDARTIASNLDPAGVEPIELDEREERAVARALDNLRWADRLKGMDNLIRLRDHLSRKGIPYELELLSSCATHGDFTSWSNAYETGDRLCNRDGDWRIVRVTPRDHEPVLLTCEPFTEDWEPGPTA